MLENDGTTLLKSMLNLVQIGDSIFEELVWMSDACQRGMEFVIEVV